MSPRYPVLAGDSRRETVIQRSRFLTSLVRVEDEAAAQAFVAGLKDEFPDANHNCWAYLVGPPGSTARVGLSDDGEPHGTAGRPMLDALLHGGVGDVAAVVTRWFGGVKLGRGGLGRAYGGCVKEALAGAETVLRTTWIDLELDVPYPLVESLARLHAAHEVRVVTEEFGPSVVQHLALPEEHLEGFRIAVGECSAGRLAPRVLDP